MKDPYVVLGVPRDADPAAIRKAFKALARKYHPDVAKEPGAEDRFKEVNAAYEILGDEQKRALWDEFGEVSTRPGFDAEQARAWKSMGGGARGGGNGAGGFRFEDLFGGGGGRGFEDILGGLGGFGGRRSGADARGRGPDIESEVEIPFLDTLRGGSVTIQLARPANCRTCRGEGGTGRRPCGACNGSGRRPMRSFGMNVVVQCDECGGAGSVYERECDTCGGTGRSREPVRLNVKVPAGVRDGQVIRLRGQGGEGSRGGPDGDLLLTVRAAPHPFLRRDGDDLELELPIALAEAVRGATVEVPLPAGRLRVRVPPGSANGRRLRVPGKGFPTASGAGDLYLVLRPVLPTATDEQTAALADALDARREGDPRAPLRESMGLPPT